MHALAALDSLDAAVLPSPPFCRPCSLRSDYYYSSSGRVVACVLQYYIELRWFDASQLSTLGAAAGCTAGALLVAEDNAEIPPSRSSSWDFFPNDDDRICTTASPH